MLHIHLTLLTFLLGSLSSFTWGYIVELWKLKKGIFSLDLSELPGGLFGRSNYINNKQINININLNSHHKNSKRDWKRSNKENLLGKKRLEMFLLIHFYSSPTIFLCCNQHFFFTSSVTNLCSKNALHGKYMQGSKLCYRIPC